MMNYSPTDFHISAYKCDLLYKEQNNLKDISAVSDDELFPDRR